MRVKQRESRHLVGVTWEWESESGMRYQLLWESDSGSMRMGVRRAGDGQWFNTSCTLADGEIRRYGNIKDAREWAHSFVESLCRHCGRAINLADDGAWNDESGACGCGDGEHEPEE